MHKLIVCLAIIAVLPFVSGANRPTVQHPTYHVNELFFLQTNTDVMEALQAYAETICVQDKVTDNSPSALLIAGAECGDSRRNADGDSLSGDGAWHGYALRAFADITQMCAGTGNAYELCRYFK